MSPTVILTYGRHPNASRRPRCHGTRAHALPPLHAPDAPSVGIWSGLSRAPGSADAAGPPSPGCTPRTSRLRQPVRWETARCRRPASASTPPRASYTEGGHRRHSREQLALPRPSERDPHDDDRCDRSVLLVSGPGGPAGPPVSLRPGDRIPRVRHQDSGGFLLHEWCGARYVQRTRDRTQSSRKIASYLYFPGLEYRAQ
jgi:hypothetical protein